LLSFITVSFYVESTSSTLLKCRFQPRDDVWKKYGCVVQVLETENLKSKISSTDGNHYEDRTDADVQTFQIEDSQTIQYFTNDVFLKFSRIQNLVVHSTSLKFLLRGDFSKAKHLVNVFITHNQITELQYDVFYGATIMKSLNLRNNQISEIDENAFLSISRLKYLILSYNKLESLNSKVFEPLPYLDNLSLIGNQIKSIHEKLFSQNQRLQVLYLSENDIETLSGTIFHNNRGLKQVFMDNNRIRRLNHVSVFLSNLKGLEIATFDNNLCVNVTIVPIEGRPITQYEAEKVFEKCTSLHWHGRHGNYLTSSKFT
jgi:hypothetical protein